ncbi:DUF2147 domain-containing protein [Spirosoma sp. SC4-14]|uniref:DUF2147 domain-containing protein n=1 Tax=Spirosoma sp. SC4-14 TaxID=3128900 RepID=UPI0030D10A87
MKRNTVLMALLTLLLIVWGGHAIAQTTLTPDAILGIYENETGERQMEIFRQNNQYFGKLISDKSDSERPLKPGTIVLKAFTFAKNEWVNGTVYTPKQGRDFKATLTMVDSQTLRINARYGLMSRSKDWKRVK